MSTRQRSFLGRPGAVPCLALVFALAACGGGGGGGELPLGGGGTGGTPEPPPQLSPSAPAPAPAPAPGTPPGGDFGAQTPPPASGGGGTTEPPPVQLSPSALAAAQPGDIAAYFKARLQLRASYVAPSTGAVFSASPAPAAPPAGTLFSGPVLQEQGVDEDDLLKTDGTTIYALHTASTPGSASISARLTSRPRLADGTLGTVTTVPLAPDFAPQGLYVAPTLSRVAVVSRKPLYDAYIASALPATTLFPGPIASFERRIGIDLFATTADGRPTPAARIEMDGSIVGTRRIGSTLYVVSTWIPDTSRFILPANATKEQADAKLASLATADLLPMIRLNGGTAQPLVTEGDCLLQPANKSLNLQLTTITAFDLVSNGGAHTSRCFVGGVESLYMSPTNVYLTSSRTYWFAENATSITFPAGSKTDIHKFALQGLQVSYRASGEVAGHLGWDAEKRPYRMSEFNGDLRVLTYTGDTGRTGPVTQTGTSIAALASPATLTVLRENASDRSLSVVSTLPNAQRPAPLGHAGEQVYAVHFAGPQAYLVTFRRTDPLYILDLSNPADPRTVGELQVPGYSDYVFPLAGGKLLGVGRDATADGRVTALKVSLFDVATPANPRLLASRNLGDAGSYSALDGSRHGINLLADGSIVRVALPVRLAEPGFRSAVQGLARFTVDTSAGTLVERPFTLATRFDYASPDSAQYQRYDLAGERSIQFTNGAYYLSGGAVTFVP